MGSQHTHKLHHRVEFVFKDTSRRTLAASEHVPWTFTMNFRCTIFGCQNSIGLLNTGNSVHIKCRDELERYAAQIS